MNITHGFAIGFFSIFGTLLIVNSVSKVYRACWPTISRWTVRHVLLPRLFRGRHIFNPTRIEVLCHLIHWTVVIMYNMWDVGDLGRAALRAGQLAVIHVVPLLITYQLGFVSRVLGLSFNVTGTVHQSLAFMALVQSTLHGAIHVQTIEHISSVVFQTIAAASLLTLSILPLIRRFAYEIFLWLHRATAIIFLIALWRHVRSSQTLSGILVIVVFGGLLASTIFQTLSQIYKNTRWGRRGVSVVRTLTARRSGDCVIVRIQLRRPWNIQPGDFIYLRLLTWKSASIFQRHPFVITWWEAGNAVDKAEAKVQPDSKTTWHSQKNARKAEVIYIMIDPRHGWTRNVTKNESAFENQVAWLDGPFGSSYRLEEYSTVILFASGHGIFAQLPLLKDLAAGLKASMTQTRRVKLVWQAETSNEQLQEWMHEILRDGQLDNYVLDICIHAPLSAEQLEARQSLNVHKIYRKSRCVKIIYDVPDVEAYLRRELKDSKSSTAVTVSGHGQLRHDVRRGLIHMKGYNVRLFELDYQPSYKNKHKGGTAV